MTTILEVKNLSTSNRKNENEKKIVKNISFKLKKNQTLAIIGESGSGKTVTMLSIMGLLSNNLHIESGEIFFNNESICNIPQKKLNIIRGNRISMIFQDALTSLNPSLTIGNQMSESLRCHLQMTTKQAKLKSIELLKSVGIDADETTLKKYPHMFSGGQRQRIMIAIAISCNPEILIADEPTTALDVSTQAQIVSLLVKQKEDLGMSMILITHNIGLVAQTADEVIVMFHGEIIEQANVFELFKNPQHAYTKHLIESVPNPTLAKNQLIKPFQENTDEQSAELIEISKNHWVRR